MAMYSEITMSHLESIANSISNIFEVTRDGDRVTFRFKDKDEDSIKVLVNEIDDEHLVSLMGMSVPNGYTIASLVGVNNWNQRQDAHGTFAYVASSDDKHYFVLESHLMLRGGVEEENIRFWLKNLIKHINPFEEQVIATLKEVGEDNNICQGNGNGIWGSLLDLTASALDTYNVWNSSRD
jgi:hypothetical protein